MTIAHERLDNESNLKLVGLLEASDPKGEVRNAWHAKEVVRSIFAIDDAESAIEFVAQLGIDLQDDSCPPEISRLGRTITKWRHQIAAWHQARFTNGPTEAVNNLVKRVKRVAFGITNCAKLPNPITALRRPPGLVAPRPQLTLKSEAPRMVGSGQGVACQQFVREMSANGAKPAGIRRHQTTRPTHENDL